ncbi:hypothetical protein JCM5350_003186 [Sporobolomyces pararoseus]
MPANRQFFQLPNDSQEAIAKARATRPKAIDPKTVPSPRSRLTSDTRDARAGQPSRAQLQEDLAEFRQRQRVREEEEVRQFQQEREMELRRWQKFATQQHKRNRAVGLPAPELAIPIRGYGETLSELGSADNARELLKELRDEDREARATQKGSTSHSLSCHERVFGSLRKNGIYGVDTNST